MDRRAAWVLGIVFGGLFLCLFGFLIILAIAVGSGGESRGFSSGGGDRVGVVEIIGAISDSKKAVKELEAFREASHIKAVVVRVDSPGGAVGPSQEIYDAVRRLREKKKVVASMGSTAASGGFYIAAAADKVYANPGTLTGSIGVIFQLPNLQGLMKWAGVEMNTVTAGKMKDVGSMFRTMTDDERQYLTRMLADVHEQFISAVAQGRGLKVEEVRPYADGRVFTGRQAKEWKLVDELGGLRDAVTEAGKLGGISGEPKTEYPKQEKKLLRELLGEEAETMFHGAAKALSPLNGPTLEYRLPLAGAQ
jgi:protease-4